MHSRGTAPTQVNKHTRVEDEGEDVAAPQPGQLHPALDGRVAGVGQRVLEAAVVAKVAIVRDRAQHAHVRLRLAVFEAAPRARHGDASLFALNFGTPAATPAHERPLLGRCGRQPIIGRRKLDVRVWALGVLLAHALLDVGVGLAAHARDALVEVLKGSALQLAAELAAARAVLGLANGRHLPCEVHQQLHHRRLRQVDNGGELGAVHFPQVLELGAAGEKRR
jgi:hypothetical protein